jgi:membrane-associated protease RseP (regulator of RpoE activity)
VAVDSITVPDLARHVEFLASDTLEGRGAGTRGGQAAATYLSGEFRRLGLLPAVDQQDFVQEFGRGYRNVLAVLPGGDPSVQQEIVLLGGHYDHVGYGRPDNSFGPFGQIHNGADDNASGTAALLEVAEALTRLPGRTRRTVMFALWDAEEEGLLGSTHWVQQPTVPIERVRLMINLDMVGRMRDQRVTVYGSRTAPGLRQTTARANQPTDLTLDYDWTQRNDSDHWPFFRRGVPYLMLHTGDHADYHRPSDDADKLNVTGLRQLAQFLLAVVCAVDAAPKLGAFREESRAEGRQRPSAVRGSYLAPARLGIAWDDQRGPHDSFLIQRVDPDSPAAVAGLQSGDQIVTVEGWRAAQVRDLRQFVLSAGETLRLTVARTGHAEPLAFQVALRGAPLRIGLAWREDSAEPGAAIVTQVIAGSSADRAGVRVDDRLYSADTGPFTDTAWLHRLCATIPASGVELWLERQGRIRRLRMLHPDGEPQPTDAAETGDVPH